MEPMQPRISPRHFVFFLALLFFSLPSCYHYRIIAPNAGNGTEPHHKTMHCFFWGLVQRGDINVDIEGKTTGISEVNITNNFGFTLATVLTLGIWCPISVKYWEAKPCPPGAMIHSNQ